LRLSNPEPEANPPTALFYRILPIGRAISFVAFWNPTNGIARAPAPFWAAEWVIFEARMRQHGAALDTRACASPV
jgi:hypothetical protein